MIAQPPSLAIKLFGTEQEDPKGRILSAGPLTALFDNGALRYIKLGEVEVLRAIAFLVRDKNWGTYTPDIAQLKIDESDQSFSVSYVARCGDAASSISYRAQISCGPDGHLQFAVDACPETDFLTNRTGFVVLHPLAGVAGRALEVEHVDGSKVSSEFPAIINPIQPFYNIRALTHEVLPGLKVTCRMEGDTFEMEDHRNWTDASFKTYVRPLAKPWPYALPAKQAFRQKVSLEFSTALPAPTRKSGTNGVTISRGETLVTQMPRMGLGLPHEEAAPALAVAELIRKSAINVLICQFDGRRDDLSATAKSVRALAEATGTGIVAEIILPANGQPADELAPIAQVIAAHGIKLDAVTVSPAPHLKAVLPGSKGPDVPSYESLYDAARAAFPGVTLGGGMYSFFTELNRSRPPAELLDFVTHTTAPIVHAADDVSVMETLEALPFVIQSTRAFIKGKPYRVGPSAIPARDNPYGAASADNPGNGRVCLAKMDPRQRGLFGAAWTLGYISAFAKGGVDVISIGAPTGPSGIIARRTDYSQPYFDGIAGPAVYPVYHVIAGLAPAAGQTLCGVTSSAPHLLSALAFQQPNGYEIWLANLTDKEQSVLLESQRHTAYRMSVLDEDAFVDATMDPHYLSERSERLAYGKTWLLKPYGIARIMEDF
jgi:hypothetical protein